MLRQNTAAVPFSGKFGIGLSFSTEMVYTSQNEREVNTLDAFEERVKRKEINRLRFILMIPVLLALLIGGAVYVFTYHINTFSLNLELHGAEKVVLEFGEAYVEPGATATFFGTHLLKDGLSVDVKIEGEVDASRVGVYQIRYSASHERWQEERIRTVEIVDTVAPMIWLAETPGSYVIPGQQYQEEGFMARDNYDGDLTDVVTKIVLNDRIIYSVEDSSGNKTEVIREIVYYDPIPPEITLEGDSSITLAFGKEYKEPGFSAYDNCDGDLTAKVQISGTVNTSKAGTYKLYYTVEDSYGNTDTAVRTVVVKARVLPKPQQSEVTPSGKVIYLTFDDGPSQHTQRLLNILAKYNVKATFFVMNTGYTHMLDDIVNQGHSIAAHTYTHNYKKIYASEEAYFDDLNSILSTIERCTGVNTKLIRFPGGSSNTVSRFNPGIMSRLTNEAVNRGYRYFDWNVSSGDAGGAKTADQVFENVINGIKGRRVSVVLQHDTKGFSVDAVERIIIWGLENGYAFLPLDSTSPTAAHGLNN